MRSSGWRSALRRRSRPSCERRGLRPAGRAPARAGARLSMESDVEVSRIEDECDKLLTTDAPLLYAPSLLAAVACLKVGGCEEKLKEILTPEALDEAKALASSSDPEEDAAALKKIRKRLKRTALWRRPSCNRRSGRLLQRKPTCRTRAGPRRRRQRPRRRGAAARDFSWGPGPTPWRSARRRPCSRRCAGRRRRRRLFA